jgi:two-component system, response regulator PdtaR
MTAPAPDDRDGRIRVVIAEDEAIIRLDLKETLQDEGYLVVGDTGRGDIAVDMVRELKPDVAILDVKMPGIDGIEAARRINREGDTAVVILTAFSQRDLIEQAVDAGALAYLVKPYKRSELVPAVEIARKRHRELRAMSEHAATLAERLDARKVIDRAKGLLMDRDGMTEQSAFSYIQQLAMHNRQTMKTVAQGVLDQHENPPPTP